MSSPTPHRFNDPIWPIRDVVGWLLDRDPAQFGRLYTDADIKSALYRRNYAKGGSPEHGQQAPTTVLLHALQRGDLVAYDGTNPVRREFWTDKTPQYIRDSTGFLFRREDVLTLWPDLRAQISQCPPPMTKSKPAPRRVAVQTKRDAVASFLAERYPEGIPPGMPQKEIARQFELVKKVRVDPRTVRRALGRS